MAGTIGLPPGRRHGDGTRPPLCYARIVEELTEGLVFLVVFLFSTTLHEASHALVAKLGGDLTAYNGGQVTLDPIPHIRREPLGMLAFPLLTTLVNGWPLGFASAPYDPHWAVRHPRRAAWMALAGPGANFFLVLVSFGLMRAGLAMDLFHAPDRVSFGHVVGANTHGLWNGVAFLLGAFFCENLLLGLFNLLPVPPMDGSGAVVLLLPKSVVPRYQEVLWSNRRLSLIGFFLAWVAFRHLWRPVFNLALNLLHPGTHYS